MKNPLELLSQLKQKLADSFRGIIDRDDLKQLDVLLEQIYKNQYLKEIANTKGGKILIEEMQSYIKAVDNALDDERHDERTVARLLERRRAMRLVLSLLLQADQNLEQISNQIEYQLND